jgi:hypothetical protein
MPAVPQPHITEQARDRAIRRFNVGHDPENVSESAKAEVHAVHDLVIELGALLDVVMPDGRDKSLALTHLEDTHIRAVRGIFSEAAL